MAAEKAALVRAFSRQALHARQLGFDHPQTGDRLDFQTEMPKDMKLLCETLESG